MGKKRKLSPLQIKEMQQIFPEVDLPVARVGDVMRLCIDLDDGTEDQNLESTTNILYARVKAIAIHGEFKDFYLDLDGVILHSPNSYVACTSHVFYSCQLRRLVGDFLDQGDDKYTAEYDVIEVSVL